MSKPYYKQVEYLESTGTQYIDTGTIAKENTRVLAKLYTEETGNKNWFGVGSNQEPGGAFVLNSYSNDSLEYLWGLHLGTWDKPTVNDVVGKPFELDFSKNGVIVNGNTISTISDTWGEDLDLTITLFVRHDGNAYISGRIYYFKIYEGSTLVRDFIPVIDNNMEPCLYDKISGDFFYNQGTGNFNYGNSIECESSNQFLRKKLATLLWQYKKPRPYYCEVEYLEAERGPYIDTGIVYEWGQNIEVNFGCSATDGYASKMVFGAYGSTATDKMCFNCYQDWSVQSPVYGYFYSNPSQSKTLSNNTVNKIEFRDGSWYYNGTLQYTSSEVENPTDLRIFLFATSTLDNAAAFQFVGKIYSAKIWGTDGSLLRDYIPVLDWDMVPAMYDKVSGKLFYNPATGTDFTYGREIHYVDYLESTGTQVIDTGIVGKSDVSFNMDVQVLEANSGFVPMGIIEQDVTTFYQLYINTSNTGLRLITNGTATTMTSIADSMLRHKIEIDYSQMKYRIDDGELENIDGTFVDSNLTYTVFGANRNSTYAFFAKLRVYGLKMSKVGILVRDYLPAIDENGVGFMFDSVEHKIYDNAGTGAFTYPDVPLEYLESTGTQYINTGYCPNAKTVLKEKLRVLTEPSAALSFTRWNASPNYDTFATYWTTPAGFNFYYGRFNAGKVLSKGASLDTDYEIEMGLTSIIVNGVPTTIVRGTDEWTNTDYPLYLFAGNNIGTATFNSVSRKYYLQLIEDGEVIHDYVPILHNGTACLYDKITQQYLTNAGTGKFKFKIVEKQ